MIISDIRYVIKNIQNTNGHVIFRWRRDSISMNMEKLDKSIYRAEQRVMLASGTKIVYWRLHTNYKIY